ncbi:nucleoside triphosphate pyrophosphohydrolase [Paenibacillus wynnii]|uniref:nucleoside triphosphate pyrophosphohydrolase n=1 Tax=Paenibacillus wynnii TaxID=268407 RepID=UPI00278FA102|nr:nucleoside triphosphate pyrophosphohydrolase [Paenibacillus wynnii]MDQ0195460.1 putative house-cleaning noncanonical NTP pyrophosphatase (MazG superfamily) [Paenibacillus wynnii]
MPSYNKLVRDGIPKLITSQGKAFNTRRLDAEEYLRELRTKLTEECNEYFAAGSDKEAIEELADMIEVILALAEAHGSDGETLERIRAKKAEQRGGFNERVFLLDVED